MAIPRFISFLEGKQYPGVILEGLPPVVSTLSLDMNSIFHEIAQIVYAYGIHADPERVVIVEQMDPLMLELELFIAIEAEILSIANSALPSDAIILCVDGCAPFAKMQQQRQRRYKTAVDRGRFIFDSNCITPGTEFMKRLDLSLRNWILKQRNVLPPKIRYSSHMSTGEGEHKIFDMIRRSLDPDTPDDDPAKGLFDPSKTHIVYGLDADLVMLSLLCPLKHVQLMRKDYRNMVNIGNLRRALKMELDPGNKTGTAVPDFVIMMYLLGNDFLPHHPAFVDFPVSIEQLFEVYRSIGFPLTSADQIVFNNFTTFLMKVAEVEPILLQKVAQKEFANPSRMITAAIRETLGNETKILDYTKFRIAWYLNALDLKGEPSAVDQIWEVFEIDPKLKEIDQDEVITMCENYLTGLSWVFRYYMNGPHFINNKFLYPFFHSPLMPDLAAVAQEMSNTEIVKDIYPTPDWDFSVLHQLLIVIPPQSISLIPYEIRELYDTKSLIADIFPIKFIVEKDGTNYSSEFLPLVPPVDPHRIITAVDALDLPNKFLLDYLETGIFIVGSERGADIYNEQRALRKRIQEIAHGRGRGGETRGRGRGRGTGGRGGYESRGRGQGRGEGRGRGYESRGRGEGRGRGESRGRGYESRGESRGRGYESRGESRGRGTGGRGRGYESPRRGQGRGRGYEPRGRGRGEYKTPEPKPMWGSLRLLM